MRKYILVTMYIGIFLIPAIAGAAVLTFDDIGTLVSGSASTIPNGYGGFNWTQVAYHRPVTSYDGYGNGYIFGLVSGDYVAALGYLNFAWVTVSGGTFDFNGAYLTAAWNDGLNILVQGYLGATKLYDVTVGPSATASTWFQFDFLGIDRLVMISYGGTYHDGYWTTGPQFAMDNFTYNETSPSPVPEPGTMMLLGSGLVGLVGYGRRRFKK